MKKLSMYPIQSREKECQKPKCGYAVGLFFTKGYAELGFRKYVEG